MSITPYPNQSKAVDLILDYLYGFNGNPVLEAPTGAGKSVIQAGLVKKTLEQWPDKTVLCLTHVQELIQQNFEAMLQVGVPIEPKIYSAGLKIKEIGQVTMASIQSIYRNLDKLPYPDLIVVDEAHLIPPKGEGMYQALLQEFPDARVVGLTATPYRLKGGLLTNGNIFNHIIEAKLTNMTMNELIHEGKLSPLVSEVTHHNLDLSDLVKHSSSDYTEKSLSEMVEKNLEQTLAAVNDMATHMADRNKVLIFATNVSHANFIAEQLGDGARVVNGKTASKERSKILAEYKASQFKYLVNVGCFTTGFDQKDIDGIVFMRPTASAGLYVQMCGRGMRTHAAKTDCLVLDYVGNIETHGPVTHVEPPPPPRESGDRANAPSVKECPECMSLLYLAATVCDECGYEFPKQYKVQSRAASANIMAKVDIREHQVTGYKAIVHTKRNAPDMIKITWKSGMLPICDQYLCINHQGYARQKAVEWFARWTGRLPTGDMNVDLETLNTMPEPPVLLKVDHGGKYPEIRNWI